MYISSGDRNSSLADQQKGLNWAAFKTTNDLRGMMLSFNQYTSPSDFFARFHHELRLTPEDKSPPSNFLALRFHLELSGKIFRVVNQYISMGHADTGTPYLVYDQQSVATLREAVGGLLGTKQETSAWQMGLPYHQVSCSISPISCSTSRSQCPGTAAPAN